MTESPSASELGIIAGAEEESGSTAIFYRLKHTIPGLFFRAVR